MFLSLYLYLQKLLQNTSLHMTDCVAQVVYCSILCSYHNNGYVTGNSIMIKLMIRTRQ